MVKTLSMIPVPVRRALLGFSFLLPMLLGTAACSVNPVSHRPELSLMTVEQEKKIGAEEAEKVEQQIGLVDDPALTDYLNVLGQRLAKESPRQDVTHHFYVADMPEPNAFALPGGYVYVTRGLLALVTAEDELAGVVGHEIGHVAARHTVQRVSKQGPFAVVFGITSGLTGIVSPLVGNLIGGVGNFAQSLVFSPYSRSQESEADEIGQEMAAKAGWDPEGLSVFLNTLGREQELLSDGPRRTSFFDSHPATPDRVKNTNKHAMQIKRAAREPISASQEVFLARLDGMVAGQRAANGIVKENTFRHPDLNLFMQFPDGWHVENTPTKVASAPKGGHKAVVFQAVAEGDDPLDGAKALEKASKTKLETKTHPTKVNGLPAATTRFAESKVTVDVTWIAHGGMVYQIAAFAPTREFQDVEPVFRQVAQSFRPLSAKERAAISEDRIRLVKARQGESVRTIAARSNTVWKPEQVAVANNVTDYEPLREGHVIKIAVSEPYEGKTK
ncbi:MAG TPA: M48 family metalloprotease [Nitrospira sp.]|jgi:predicted Zn-dependent protease